MRCDDFEEKMSEYIDGGLGEEEAQRIENHALFCTTCSDFLSGILQARLVLQDLGEKNPPASFELRLSNCLQEEFLAKERSWVRPLALGLALAVALAILLWPNQPEDVAERLPLEAQENLAWEWERVENFQSGGIWIESFPGLSGANRHSHVQARPAAF